MNVLSSFLHFLGFRKQTHPELESRPVKRLSLEDRFGIVKAVFDKDELGPPLDWASLADADKALLSAFLDRDAVRAREALAAGANADLNCGFGCTTIMLAAATGDAELVAAFRQAGGARNAWGRTLSRSIELRRGRQATAIQDGSCRNRAALGCKACRRRSAGPVYLRVGRYCCRVVPRITPYATSRKRLLCLPA